MKMNFTKSMVICSLILFLIKIFGIYELSWFAVFAPVVIPFIFVFGLVTAIILLIVLFVILVLFFTLLFRVLEDLIK